LAIIAGIDEAGLGPVLGPLVVGSAVFEVPDEQAGVSLWRLLAGAVAKRPSRRRAVVPVGDSKKLYSGLRGRGGLANLELGVLAMLSAGGFKTRSLRELMESISPQAVPASRSYPWYSGGDLPLPQAISSTKAALSGNAVGAAMSRVPMRLLDVRAEIVFEGEFNRLVSATDNKSSTLFDVTCRLLMRIWRRVADEAARSECAEPARIYIDRQGGRMRYLPGLQRVFDGCGFKVLEETDSLSAYRLSRQGAAMELYFQAGCEDRHLPAALASMVCKYARELLMAGFNGFWATLIPDIAPTAGYYEDGNRFYREIQPAVSRLGFDRQLLYRIR